MQIKKLTAVIAIAFLIVLVLSVVRIKVIPRLTHQAL